MMMHDEDMLEQIERWEIDERWRGERLDKTAAALAPGLSRSLLQQLIKTDNLRVNGQPAKPNYRVALGDIIELTIPQATDVGIEPEKIDLHIVYEDSDVIIVNKERGMVVHPAAGHTSGTLVNALLHHCVDLSGINGEIRPGIVHRIDKDTSGLLVSAKNDRAHVSLSEQLKAHTVTRKYIAVVHGEIPHDQGTVDAPIGRDPHDRKRFAVQAGTGKRAVTHFRVLERLSGYSLLELKLETGRTHQIRVHMLFIGHPLVGDPVYGRSKGATMDGQALHAAVLGFEHPSTGERMEFEAPLPNDMQQLLHIIRNQ